jgi:hypothetical protein
MAFWSETGGSGPEGRAYDPKRQFRWVLRVDKVPAYVLKSVDKPSFDIGEAEHKFLNHTYYYPGRTTWQPINMTLADPVDPDMAATVADIIRTAGYNPIIEANEAGLTTMSKAKAVNALGAQFEIAQLDSDANEIERWVLKNAWVQSVKLGNLDYEGDDLTNIEITVRYDWASLITARGGYTNASREFWTVGSPTGGT